YLVIFINKGFCVNLVLILSARWPRRKPRIVGGDLQPANGRAVAFCLSQLRGNSLAGKFRGRNLFRRQCFQDGLLLTVSSRIGACVDGRAEFISKLCVALRWALSR